MISKIYLKLVRYFIALILITCFASMVLFFATVGYPMAKDFHRLLRKHALYISYLTSEKIRHGESIDEINRFLQTTAKSYEACVVLYDQNLKRLAGSDNSDTDPVIVTFKMLSEVKAGGLFVQPSHMGKPLVYLLPVSSSGNTSYYLCIYKSFSRFKRYLVFFSGLALLCLILILAIYPLSKGFTRPIIQLTCALKDISAGNFDATIESGKRNDELGELLMVFREMSLSLHNMIESRKELLADISHELRSPLSRLGIASELIKESGPSPETGGYADAIEYEIDYMNTLVKQLTDYSTLNLPTIYFEMEPLPVMQILEDVFRHYQPIIDNQKINYKLIPNEADLVVMADRSRIRQVLTNLLDNALYSCSTGGEITMGCSESGAHTLVFVTNTGPEIPEHLRESIYDPLFRVDPSRNRKTGGLGLGLSICRKIIDHHGGILRCDCKNGVTRFIFKLETVFLSVKSNTDIKENKQ